MADIPTQAEIARCVKAAIRGAHDMGYRVAGHKVTFHQGVPSVEVTYAPESPSHSGPANGGVNVADFKEALRSRHASRRP